MQSDAAGAVSPRAVVGEGPVRQQDCPALNGELVPSVGIDCKPQSGGLGQPARPEVNCMVPAESDHAPMSLSRPVRFHRDPCGLMLDSSLRAPLCSNNQIDAAGLIQSPFSCRVLRDVHT